MKLIFCPLCRDVFGLIAQKWRKCICGESGGQYNRDLMTATIGGVARVFGVGNTFFNEYWPLLTPEAKEKVRNQHGFTGSDAWWGDYPGERQLFHVEDANGPRLIVRVTAKGARTNIVTIVDKRQCVVDGQTTIRTVEVPRNLLAVTLTRFGEGEAKRGVTGESRSHTQSTGKRGRPAKINAGGTRGAVPAKPVDRHARKAGQHGRQRSG